MYVANADDAQTLINSDCVTNGTGLASNLQIYCSSSISNLEIRDEVGYTLEKSFTGVFYAPGATLEIVILPNETLDFYGEVVVNSLFDGFPGALRFHYDEALGQMGYVLLPGPALAANLILPTPCTMPFEFYVDGMPNTNYAVETSTDLNNWLPVFTNTAPFSFADTNSASLNQNFYRAVYIP